MMIGEIRRPHPTVQVPQWDPYDDPTAATTTTITPYYPGAHSSPASSDYSPSAFVNDYAAALQRHLSCDFDSNSDTELELLFDSFSCDEFRMYEFKVRRCVRGRSHDWTDCPFAHPGEKARRRDPRLYHYSGGPCPDFRKGGCRKGDSCEFAHGVFECWLHPTRYRTQPCKDGTHCKRRVCFFAHSPEQLRIMPDPESPPSEGFPSESPPTSPPSRAIHENLSSVSELACLMRGLRVGKMDYSLSKPRCSLWGFGSGFGSPRSGSAGFPLNPTNIGAPTRSGMGGLFDTWNPSLEEEPAMERVESGSSGRDIRVRMYTKLRIENPMDLQGEVSGPVPDFRWISELMK